MNLPAHVLSRRVGPFLSLADLYRLYLAGQLEDVRYLRERIAHATKEEVFKLWETSPRTPLLRDVAARIRQLADSETVHYFYRRAIRHDDISLLRLLPLPNNTEPRWRWQHTDADMLLDTALDDGARRVSTYLAEQFGLRTLYASEGVYRGRRWEPDPSRIPIQEIIFSSDKLLEELRQDDRYLIELAISAYGFERYAGLAEVLDNVGFATPALIDAFQWMRGGDVIVDWILTHYPVYQEEFPSWMIE